MAKITIYHYFWDPNHVFRGIQVSLTWAQLTLPAPPPVLCTHLSTTVHTHRFRKLNILDQHQLTKASSEFYSVLMGKIEKTNKTLSVQRLLWWSSMFYTLDGNVHLYTMHTISTRLTGLKQAFCFVCNRTGLWIHQEKNIKSTDCLFYVLYVNLFHWVIWFVVENILYSVETRSVCKPSLQTFVKQQVKTQATVSC